MGSRKGIPNRPKRRLIQILEEQFPGWHPVTQLAGIANDTELDLRTRMDAAKEVAQYVTPKLKAVEIQGNNITGLSDLLNQLKDWEAATKPSIAIEQPTSPAQPTKTLN